MDKKLKIAEQLAVSKNYDIVEHYSTWNNFDVFNPGIKTDIENDEISCTGYPEFIIVDKNNNARFASTSEVFDIMDIHFIEDKNYSEVL